MNYTFVLATSSKTGSVLSYALVPNDTVMMEQAELAVRYPKANLVLIKPETIKKMILGIEIVEEMERLAKGGR